MRILLPLCVLLLGLVACGDPAASPGDTPGPVTVAADPAVGLMDRYCGICHAVPAPTDLDQKTWRDFILVRMGAYMGIYYAYEGSYDNVAYYDSVPDRWLEPGIGGERVLRNHIYPEQAILPRQEFEQIRDYILKNAPAATTGPVGAFAIPKDLDLFEARLVPLPVEDYQSLTSAVTIVPEEKAVYAGLFQQALFRMDAQGQIQDRLEGITMPVQITVAPDQFSVVDLGTFGGSDHPQGAYLEARSWQDFKRKSYRKQENDLMRPVQHHVADLDGDGDEDRLILEFGYHLGRMVWVENDGGGEVEHELFGDDGAGAAVLHDWNGDGRPDIAALLANSDERLVIYENLGDGEFRPRTIERYPPSWGGSNLELADMDGDGQSDLVTVHGDNGDYPPILKAGHGIRIYRHTSGFDFAAPLILPLNGAYGTRARDFDLDGDLDIAAVAFYPDYRHRPEEQFVYYEQTRPMTFEPHTFPEVNAARWMVLDAGDVDGDGDEDLVLGGFNVQSDDVSQAMYTSWSDRNVALAILENQSR